VIGTPIGIASSPGTAVRSAIPIPFAQQASGAMAPWSSYSRLNCQRSAKKNSAASAAQTID
jgi:hypothetical protein